MSTLVSKKLFIVNPISGGKDKSFLPTLLKKELKDAHYELIYTNGPEHATSIAVDGIKRGFTDFIAVGGDGTVNEVAKALIGTEFNMGILPQGSGNGLARHNKIPMQMAGAVRLLNNPNVKRIDTCKLNNMPFINASGVGFDAHIGKLFSENKHGKRGFSTYFNMTVNEFKNYKSQNYAITADGVKLDNNAFLITFANSSQYGNNAFIAPSASMTDGMIDLCIMKPFPPLNIIELGFKLFTGGINDSMYVESVKAKVITVHRESAGDIHLDGEPFQSGRDITVEIVPNSLNLLILGDN
ncbi:MAG: diacylglycerol/lipid kinase family protein [Cytophagales bacterium]